MASPGLLSAKPIGNNNIDVCTHSVPSIIIAGFFYDNIPNPTLPNTLLVRLLKSYKRSLNCLTWTYTTIFIITLLLIIKQKLCVKRIWCGNYIPGGGASYAPPEDGNTLALNTSK